MIELSNTNLRNLQDIDVFEALDVRGNLINVVTEATRMLREYGKSSAVSEPRLKVSIKDRWDNLILDPSFFAYRKVLWTFFESNLLKEHRVIIPSLLYDSIRTRNYEKFVGALSVWEGTPHGKLEEVWSEIMDLSNRILQTFIPCSKVLDELTEDKREALRKVEKTLSIPERRYRLRSKPAIEMAREIIMTACVTSLILSISDKARKWYNKLNGTVVKKAEENRTLMKIKEGYREKMKAAGWKARVLVWLAKHAPIAYSGDFVDVVMIVFANGTYRCHICGKSLRRCPTDIKFCPYCSASLP